MAEDFLSKMTAATTAASSATPETGDAAAAADTEAAEQETEDAAPEGQTAGQQAKPDPWDDLKKRYTPEQLAGLEREAEEARNAKAMRREASVRNEEAAKLKAAAEEDRRVAREALDRTNLMIESVSALSADNPELGAQLLATFNRASGGAAQSGGTAQSARTATHVASDAEKRIAALQAEVESLKKGQNELAFGLNTRELTALAWDAVEKDSVLNRDAIRALGIPDRVVQNAVQAVYADDMAADPADRIDPYDRRALQKAVAAKVKAEVDLVTKMRSAFITDYRTEKKAKHAALPPSSKGQSASVRVGPTSQTAPPMNAPRAVRTRYWEEQMLAATRPKPKSGEIA